MNGTGTANKQQGQSTARRVLRRRQYVLPLASNTIDHDDLIQWNSRSHATPPTPLPPYQNDSISKLRLKNSTSKRRRFFHSNATNSKLLWHWRDCQKPLLSIHRSMFCTLSLIYHFPCVSLCPGLSRILNLVVSTYPGPRRQRVSLGSGPGRRMLTRPVT